MRYKLFRGRRGSRRGFADVGQPISASLNQHLGLNLFAGFELVKLLLVLDGYSMVMAGIQP
jgi:hypothetical protein